MFAGIWMTPRFGSRSNEIVERRREAEELCFCWETRLENEARAVGLKKIWEQFGEHDASVRVKKWFQFLVATGVRKCVEKEVTDPCWMAGEKILEKGTLK